jgi:hypothetical protein
MTRNPEWTSNLGKSIGSSAVLLIGLAVTAVLAGCESDRPVPAGLGGTLVTINELQSRNSTIESDTNKKSDWVELYNGSETDEELEGFFVSDDAATPKKAKLPSLALVPAKGFLVLWLDDTLVSGTPLHFPFKLSGSGDHFFLNDPNGNTVQEVALPADPTGTSTTAPDVSYGAYPDGSHTYAWCATPTPGKPNAADCGADAGH